MRFDSWRTMFCAVRTEVPLGSAFHSHVVQVTGLCWAQSLKEQVVQVDSTLPLMFQTHAVHVLTFVVNFGVLAGMQASV